jgi:phenylpropionate dioxygenase-like ring-hydroxylating dioxygenase large terminal subunit
VTATRPVTATATTDLLDHWHPVCLDRELGDTPRQVWLDGTAYAVFRAGDRAAGRIGAVPDACPHRGMRLSAGTVDDGQIVCPYHGWSFAPGGAGKAPGTPQMRPHTACLEAVSRFGVIWMRRGGATSPFPAVGPQGYSPVSVTRHRVAAPLETVLDNFTEVEHTGAVHWLLGYPPESIEDIRVDTTYTADSVRVFNRGPQRRLPRLLTRLLSLRRGDHFIDDWTTRFSPVHTVFEQYWVDPQTAEHRGPHVHIGVVYTPVHPQITDVYTLAHTNAPKTGRFGLDGLFHLLLKGFAEVEVRLDATLLGSLADPSAGVRGRRLGRFDAVMRLHRKRIESIYRGGQPPGTP